MNARVRPAHDLLEQELRDEVLAPRIVPGNASDAALLAKPKELWIAVHLPWIPLEALVAPQLQPIAVVELIARAQYVVAADPLARQGGVRPGMTLAAALVLVPELQAKPRDPRREQVFLEQLATRVQRFTSRVSIVQPDGLLLEVKGSLNLFGGAKKLGRAVIADCLEGGARPVIALAPTPLAALAGARAGKTFIVTEGAKLIGQISALPLIVLRWPMDVIERLGKVGVHTIGEALRLPRAGFARRFGKDALAMLDQLAGRTPDLRKEFRARERFRKKRDLTYEIEHHEGVLEILEPLLQELEKFLRGRQCGITALQCRLKHRHAPATRCVLKLAAPEADASRLKALFAERLSTLVLPEPVRACELRSGPLIDRALHANSLWRPGEHGGEVGSESSAFIELLRARLGSDAVHSLQVHPEHRPEAAWCIVEPEVLSPARAAPKRHTQKPKKIPAPAGSKIAAPYLPLDTTPKPQKISAPAGATPQAARPPAPGTASHAPIESAQALPWAAYRRPIWLLSDPQPLTEHEDHMPRYRGPLRLTGEPERIETGWWDGKDISRDYYNAVDVRGVTLWIYRDCHPPHHWYLHGFFG